MKSSYVFGLDINGHRAVQRGDGGTKLRVWLDIKTDGTVHKYVTWIPCLAAGRGATKFNQVAP